MKKLSILLGAGLMFSMVANAQTCKNSINARTPNDRLLAVNESVILDAKTGIYWSKCLEGQTLNGDFCQGEPTLMTWQEALQHAKQLNDAGGLYGKADWRLPNIKELASIIENQCHSPAINNNSFPATPSFGHWSSTASVANGESKEAYAIDFRYGLDVLGLIDANTKFYVRLMRTGDGFN